MLTFGHKEKYWNLRQGIPKVNTIYPEWVMSVSSKFPSRSWFPNTNLYLYCVTFISRNNQCVTHKDNTICSISLPVLYSCFVFPQTVTSHRAWSSITVSAGIQTLCPPSPPRRLFFKFPFVPSFSRLPPQLSVCGQRSTALSQVHAGTAATGFTRRRH